MFPMNRADRTGNDFDFDFDPDNPSFTRVHLRSSAVLTPPELSHVPWCSGFRATLAKLTHPAQIARLGCTRFPSFFAGASLQLIYFKRVGNVIQTPPTVRGTAVAKALRASNSIHD
jgi:hypothetical protein